MCAQEWGPGAEGEGEAGAPLSRAPGSVPGPEIVTRAQGGCFTARAPRVPCIRSSSHLLEAGGASVGLAARRQKRGPEELQPRDTHRPGPLACAATTASHVSSSTRGPPRGCKGGRPVRCGQHLGGAGVQLLDPGHPPPPPALVARAWCRRPLWEVHLRVCGMCCGQGAGTGSTDGHEHPHPGSLGTRPRCAVSTADWDRAWPGPLGGLRPD